MPNRSKSEVPIMVGNPLAQSLNLYVWDIDGHIRAENQQSYTHPTLKGLHISDLIDLDPQIQRAWEKAKNGEAAVWIPRDKTITQFALFLPWFKDKQAPRPTRIIGIGFLFTENDLEWLARNQAPVNTPNMTDIADAGGTLASNIFALDPAGRIISSHSPSLNLPPTPDIATLDDFFPELGHSAQTSFNDALAGNSSTYLATIHGNLYLSSWIPYFGPFAVKAQPMLVLWISARIDEQTSAFFNSLGMAFHVDVP